MTLPTLIQKQQEKVKVTQLKKIYSILTQAYNSAVFDTGYDPKDWEMGGMYNPKSHIRMAEKFLPYLNVSENCIGKNDSYVRKHCTAKWNDTSSYASVRLIDGTTVIFRIWSGNCTGNYGTSKPLQKNVCGSIYVDLNNIRNPDTLGQDTFGFYLTNYGIVPMGTPFDKMLTFEKYCDKSRGFGSSYGGYDNGMGCTAWILYNENMEYLHCSGLSWSGKGKCK